MWKCESGPGWMWPMRLAGFWSQGGISFCCCCYFGFASNVLWLFLYWRMKACGLEQGWFSHCHWELRMVGTLAEIRTKRGSLVLCRARRIQWGGGWSERTLGKKLQVMVTYLHSRLWGGRIGTVAWGRGILSSHMMLTLQLGYQRTIIEALPLPLPSGSELRDLCLGRAIWESC